MKNLRLEMCFIPAISKNALLKVKEIVCIKNQVFVNFKDDNPDHKDCEFYYELNSHGDITRIYTSDFQEIYDGFLDAREFKSWSEEKFIKVVKKSVGEHFFKFFLFYQKLKKQFPNNEII